MGTYSPKIPKSGKSGKKKDKFNWVLYILDVSFSVNGKKEKVGTGNLFF